MCENSSVVCSSIEACALVLNTELLLATCYFRTRQYNCMQYFYFCGYHRFFLFDICVKDAYILDQIKPITITITKQCGGTPVCFASV